jgi:hypothetical protein
MDENHISGSLKTVLRAAIDAADGELFVINPTAETVEELLAVLDGDGPTLKVLAAADVLKHVADDFKLASVAADLREADRLALRTYEGDNNTLLVTASSLAALVSAGGHAAALTSADESFIADAHEQYVAAFEDAKAFSLRTPGITRVRSSLSESLGEETAADFDGVLESMETARGNGDGLDEVTVALLVAAKNKELLYDISKWGEDVGIASKATFSRTKTELEECGLIDTEKVPIDVGRPRLRLKVGDDRLSAASTGELASVAQSVLAK